MGKRAVHWRWFDKSKPAPPWLYLGRQLHELPGWSSYDEGARHRLRYYRTIWNATPRWANEAMVKSIYAQAHDMRAFGLDVVVDHVIPLHSPFVCGLHCEANLAVVDRIGNARKSNHNWPGAPVVQLGLAL